MRRTLGALLALVISLFLVACGGPAHHHPTAPRPQLPKNLVAPPQCSGTNHTLGSCLPHPKSDATLNSRNFGLSPERSLAGCDFSNNNPVFSSASWRAIAARNSWCYLKVSEGSTFNDGTARAMAAAAKAAGIPVGGYAFQHVCHDSPVAEADRFAADLRADGLLGPGTMRPMADVEFGNGSCGARAWENAWRKEVIARTGENPGEYTGAWFSNPTFGCWWPAPLHGQKTVGWISGYTSSLSRVPRPCGLSAITSWQNSDRQFNGATVGDHSIWVAGSGSLRAFIVAKPAPPKPKPTSKELKRWRGALATNQHLYAQRNCGVFAQRVSWFARQLKAHPKVKAAVRKRALTASRKAYAKRGCAVFAQRIRYFQKKLA